MTPPRRKYIFKSKRLMVLFNAFLGGAVLAWWAWAGLVMSWAVIALLLGGLWLLQGLGVVHLQPILCFADCAPLQGPSLGWVFTGGAVATLGVALVVFALQRRSHDIVRKWCDPLA